MLKSRILITVRSLLLAFACASAVLLGVRVADANIPISFDRTFGYFGTKAGAFNGPTGIAVNVAGRVIVADTANNRVQIFEPSGTFIREFGTPGTGPSQFDAPRDVAIDSNGNIYVADTGNNRVQIFDVNGIRLGAFGATGTTNGAFNRPGAIALSAEDRIYVADTLNHRVQMFANDGSYIGQFGVLGSENGQFNSPGGLDVSLNGDVIVADSGNNRIQIFDADGQFIRTFGVAGQQPGELINPLGIETDASGDIYVADDTRFQVFNADGLFLAAAPTDNNRRQFSGMALALDGTIYLTDTMNHRVDVFREPGNVTGCFVLAPSEIFEGERFTATVVCNNLQPTQRVFGFQFGISWTDALLRPLSDQFTPGSFVTQTDAAILQGKTETDIPNSLSLYAVSRKGDANEQTGTFTLGSVAFETDTGLTANTEITISLDDLILSDRQSTAIEGVLAPRHNGVVAIKDKLSVTGQLSSELETVQLERLNPRIQIGATIFGHGSGATSANNTLMLDAADVFPVPVGTVLDLTANINGHLACTQQVPLTQSATQLNKITLPAGDVNDDGKIDIHDASLIGLAMDTVENVSDFEVDVNGDNAVNVLDLVSVGRNYDLRTGACFDTDSESGIIRHSRRNALGHPTTGLG